MRRKTCPSGKVRSRAVPIRPRSDRRQLDPLRNGTPTSEDYASILAAPLFAEQRHSISLKILAKVQHFPPRAGIARLAGHYAGACMMTGGRGDEFRRVRRGLSSSFKDIGASVS
jgi:hypothetical protein